MCHDRNAASGLGQRPQDVAFDHGVERLVRRYVGWAIDRRHLQRVARRGVVEAFEHPAGDVERGDVMTQPRRGQGQESCAGADVEDPRERRWQEPGERGGPGRAVGRVDVLVP